jgi:hypothetical protein
MERTALPQNTNTYIGFGSARCVGFAAWLCPAARDAIIHWAPPSLGFSIQKRKGVAKVKPKLNYGTAEPCLTTT